MKSGKSVFSEKPKAINRALGIGEDENSGRFAKGIRLGEIVVLDVGNNDKVIGARIADSDLPLEAERHGLRNRLDELAGMQYGWSDADIVLDLAEFNGDVNAADQIIDRMKAQVPQVVDVYDTVIRPATLHVY